MDRFIALLRGINVSGHNKVPMAELRALCADLGWQGAETYIQSGNLVFTAAGEAADLEQLLEARLGRAFGFTPAVMVRTAAQWKALAAANPFAAASHAEPNRVLMGITKSPPAPGAAEALEARAAAGERVVAAGGALWFHYPIGVGTSKLSPALIDRAAGSALTARNWRTVLALSKIAVA